VGSFGDKLKREREMRAITLEEISDATKIGTRSLKALEDEQFDQLPGGIFNKGFVRAYAKFLGIDEEQAVADYVSATGDTGNTTVMQMAAFNEQVEAQRAAKAAAESGIGAGAMLASVIALIVVCGIGFGGFKAWQYKKEQQERGTMSGIRAHKTQPPVDKSAPAASTDANTAVTDSSATNTSATPDANTTTAAPGSTGDQPVAIPKTQSKSATDTPKKISAAESSKQFPIMVTVKAVSRAWIMVTSDGKMIYQQTMDPQDAATKEVTLHGRDKMQLVLGNPAGVEVSFNGKPLGPLGVEGQRREVTITPQGIER
jgi:cytoskeleton protein RodZ